MAELLETKISLDNLSLQLLKQKCDTPNVEAYFRAAEVCIQKTIKYDRKSRHEITSNKPLQKIIRLSMDKIATAYVLITNQANEEQINQLLDEYESLLRTYLQESGYLIKRPLESTT